MKQIKLNNETFKVRHFKGELHPITQVRSLTDCYARPSEAKKDIYQYWFHWYMGEDNNFILKHFSVNSYNAQMFTLRCDVYNMEDEFIGQLYISKTRQEFWTI